MDKSWIVAALLVSALGMVANATAGEPVIAELRIPAAKKTKIVGAGTIFYCEGSRCVASNPNSQSISVEACKRIAQRLGVVESLGDATRSLSESKLAACRPAKP